MRPLFAALLAVLVVCWPTWAEAAVALTEAEASEIAVEAYVYLYPLVLMDVTRRQATNVEEVRPGGRRGPMNALVNLRMFPPATFKAVVRPNFDTLYSLAWLDLATEPIIVSVPDTNGRMFILPFMDMWTDVFAVAGKRTTGPSAGSFAVVLSGWTGQLPAGVQRFDSPTPSVWMIGRTQTNGLKDYPAVHKIQDGFRITPLSRWGHPTVRVKGNVDRSVDMNTAAPRQIHQMPAAEFFRYAAELMKVNRPHITDQPILARMKRIGLEAGKSFDFDNADPVVKRALEKAPAAALKAMNAKLPTLARLVNGWQMNTETVGVYGNHYLKRAIIAMMALGAVSPEDAIYLLNFGDREDKVLDGANKYVLHFNKGELPPVHAFWSITLYDKDGYPIANRLNRFAIGDRDALLYNQDGSLDLYVQHEKPGKDKESNWLPAPRGPFNLTLRLFSPKPPALDGRWSPPAVFKVP